ncbi:outer membrane beta-barrel protein [Shivajiella indica]|uniref:Outer membrane beta-barrel protein n=1 Tax=Shivajiella indica TaxID=872115 RepID=A0ABW5BDQ6_9BACT
MKTILKTGILIFAMVMFYQSTYAQSGNGFGIRGGLNYNSNGQYFKDAEAVWGDPWSNLGYNLGVFGKVPLGLLFLRPELTYTNLKSEINSDQYTTQRLDAPVLVGINLIGPLVSVFAGPSFHYYLEDELRDFDFNKFNAGYQFGVGVNLGNLGIDLRYERVLNGQTIDIDNVFTGDGDFRYQQLLLGLSLKF